MCSCRTQKRRVFSGYWSSSGLCAEKGGRLPPRRDLRTMILSVLRVQSLFEASEMGPFLKNHEREKNSHGGHGGAEGDNVGGRCHSKIVARWSPPAFLDLYTLRLRSSSL